MSTTPLKHPRGPGKNSPLPCCTVISEGTGIIHAFRSDSRGKRGRQNRQHSSRFERTSTRKTKGDLVSLVFANKPRQCYALSALPEKPLTQNRFTLGPRSAVTDCPRVSLAPAGDFPKKQPSLFATITETEHSTRKQHFKHGPMGPATLYAEGH
ncbi:unnamed protein product [Ectocarpus fasciculatus]